MGVVVLIVFAVFCLVMAICKATIWSEKAQKENALKEAESQFTSEQLKWLKTVGKLYGENRVMSLLDVYVECGMPKEVAYSKDSELITNNIPFSKGTGGYNVVVTYAMAISRREDLMYKALIEVPAERYGLTLKSDEHIYSSINVVSLYKEKVSQINVTYSGVRWQSGMLRAGSMNVIGQEIRNFIPMDCGRLLITNKKLIFIGKQNNTTLGINISTIIYTTMYQDGIMIHRENVKPLLFKFDQKADFEMLLMCDGMFEFMTVLSRVKDGTVEMDLNV